MSKLEFKAEMFDVNTWPDGPQLSKESWAAATVIAQAIYDKHDHGLRIRGFTIQQLDDKSFWFARDDGEAMGIGVETMEKIFKEHM